MESTDGALRGLFLNLGQWVFEESSRTGDSAIFAFQGATSLSLADGVLWNLGVADYHLQKPSTIAVAKGRNATIVVTNAVRLSDGSIIEGRAIDATRLGEDAEGNPITIRGYVSDFNLVNAGTDVTIPTGLAKFPLKVFFDYVVNTEAEGSEDTGYEGGLQVGLDEEPGDLSFIYAWEHLETDAVISAFTESDFGPDGGTNTEGHILRLSYVLLKNLAFTSTAYITEPIDEVEGRNPGNQLPLAGRPHGAFLVATASSPATARERGVDRVGRRQRWIVDGSRRTFRTGSPAVFHAANPPTTSPAVR